MFCRQCGAQNESSSAFCVNCGAPMSVSSVSLGNATAIPEVSQPASPSVLPTPPAPAPTTQTVVPITITSHFARGAYALLREIGWVLWEVCLDLGRATGSAWSFARQRRLHVHRDRALRDIGQELSQGAVPASMAALLRERDRHSDEIKRCLNGLASQTPRPGWMSRIGLRTRLSEAQSARNAALRKLGEKGISFAPPAHQEEFQSIEAAIVGQQARRRKLWEPWRALNLRRQMEVFVVTVLLLGATILFASHFTKPWIDDQIAKIASSEPKPRDGSLTAGQKVQVDNERSRKLPLDFAKERKALPAGRWLPYSGNPVLLRGELNEWDDFKVGSPAVLKEGDRYRMWYRGCHFIGLEYTCGVGYATATDGISWKKSSDPVFVPQDAHERERLDSLTIVKAGNQYWMWYSVRADPFTDHPYITIHLATSKDGLSWQSVGAVLRALSQWTLALEPSAFFDGKLFHMWYTDYPSDEHKTMLHLTSANGTQWQTAGSTSFEGLKELPGKLSVLSDGHGGYRALFPYSESKDKVGDFGILLSADGNQWRLADDEKTAPPAEVPHHYSKSMFVHAPAALTTWDGLAVWFGALPEKGDEEIRLAFLKERAL